MQQPDVTVVRGVFERARLSASVEEVERLGVVCRVEPADAHSAVLVLQESDLAFDYLVDLFGIDTGEAVDVVYHLRSFSRDEEVYIKAAHTYDGELRSVWELFPAAAMPERELCELFGLDLVGHPNPRRLLTTDGCPPYLRKTTEIRSAEEVRDRAQQVVDTTNLRRKASSLAPAEPLLDDEEPVPHWERPDETRPAGRRPLHGVDRLTTDYLVLNMGPQHPSTHGVLRILVEIEGEEVMPAETAIGYLHRGIEKLSENRDWTQIVLLTDRMDYVASAAANLAYVETVEKLMSLEVPRRAKYVRTILAELQRIASHLVWLGSHAMDIGAVTVFLYCLRERELILDLFEEYCGARLTYNSMRIGGLPLDVPPGWDKKVLQFCGLQLEKLVNLSSQQMTPQSKGQSVPSQMVVPPATQTLPESGAIKPMMCLIKTLFPTPLCPMITNVSPSRIFKSRPSSTVFLLSFLLKPYISIFSGIRALLLL